MITIEQILGFALRESQVLNRLGGALRNDLVTPNPYYRRVVEFGDDFQQERGKLPVQGDYQLWLDSLPEAQRSGTSEALGRLQNQTFHEFDPEFFAEEVLETLRETAANTALARMNSNPKGNSLETFRTLNERIESVGFESRGGSLQSRCLADIEPEEVSYLCLQPRFPRGAIVELGGNPGVGKSTLTREISAAVSSGRPLPGDLQLPRKKRNIVLLSAEDSPSRTIRPGLERAGADLGRIHIIDGPMDDKGIVYPFSLRSQEEREKLTELLGRLDAAILVVDTISAFLGNLDSYKDSEVRTLLGPISSMADRLRVTILLIRHLNKNSAERNPLFRMGGSIAFTAASRSSLLVEEMRDGTGLRALAAVKNTYAPLPPTLGFTLEDGLIQWKGKLPGVTAEDLLRTRPTAEERTEREEAGDWLREILRDGPLSAKEIQERAKREMGCSWQTIKRAKGMVRVKSHYNGEEKSWSWSLEDGAAEQGVQPPLNPLLQEDPEPLAKSLAIKGDLMVSPEQGVQPSPLEPLAPESASPALEKAP